MRKNYWFYSTTLNAAIAYSAGANYGDRFDSDGKGKTYLSLDFYLMPNNGCFRISRKTFRAWLKNPIILTSAQNGVK